jgi:ferredoxin
VTANLWDKPVEDGIAYRLLRLEQRLASYEQLHAQELRDMRQELDALRRQVVLRSFQLAQAATVQVDVPLCNGCGQCVSACPQGMFELRELDGRWVAILVADMGSHQVQTCAECQLESSPCVAACAPQAIALT